MSAKTSRRIDSFYAIFLFVVIALAALTIFTFRGIFSTFATAYEIDQGTRDSKLRINKGKLDDAIKAAYEREKVPLKVE